MDSPRINLRRDMAAVVVQELPAQLVPRKEEKCSDSSESNTCEKPVDSSTNTIGIVIGVVVPALIAVCVLFYLHRRSIRRQRMEDRKDPNMDLDFGMDVAPKKKRKSLMFGAGEKQIHKPGQLSMDMNLSSPYLLPPGVHQSRDSLHSLARTLPNEQDPYRTIAHYANSDAGSIRSFPTRDPSMYNKRMSVVTGKSVGTVRGPPTRNNSIPISSPTSPVGNNPFATPIAEKPSQDLPAHPAPAGRNINQSVADPVDTSRFDTAPSHGNESRSDELHLGLQQPPAALAKETQYRPPSRPTSSLSDRHQNYGNDGRHEQEPAGLGLDFDFPKPSSPVVHAPSMQENSPPQIQTSTYYDEEEDYGRGRTMERQSRILPDQGLAVPEQSNKRLSVGFRPLPPDEVTESEDPEYRANRIRSFYKEYFDDTKDAPLPPVPALPQSQSRGKQEYYEDYDAGYLGEAAYYDADSNAFVMPYAQPVTRRAMTPPPAGRSRGPGGPGPLGPPRGPFGGGMRTMSPGPGPRRPRAGSLGPRGPPSAYSSRAPSSLGPRPDSSASARGPRQPKKMGPPPSVLHTLPTPSKLKDDSFAILGAGDFAPPESFKDFAAGRSQSPLGERRPYQNPSVPVASPLVTAFDELAALPSPHVLRKSSTFTNLDFAPPKKFKDADTMSDAGSIRSNRSGISAVQLTAIRSGAGRVSRLPGDTVFTQAAMQDELKPKWGMRP
ncbi:hypothetical protein HJFPF1_00430 [Paramyrothecium foliicola]|nr:hypothetical protein HJFPF1_00430 [Paramyrothecium foliicola]